MIYDVKKPILGFENVLQVELQEIDGLFSSLEAIGTEITSWTLVNPYQLREYSFDIPKNVQVLLDIKEDSDILVYNIVVLNNPIKNSVVNFKAPLLFNKNNGKMAQFVLEDEGFETIGELLELKKQDASE
jgi:flagellar assembly factor FliW